jgi:hypothetical protein
LGAPTNGPTIGEMVLSVAVQRACAPSAKCHLAAFLEKPGVPLDNNIVERALKKAILHRKNSWFYKTRKGAQMGALFMSLIHTCELNGVNAFDYLTELQRHAEELKKNPAEWMPWNYRETLARLARSAAA